MMKHAFVIRRKEIKGRVYSDDSNECPSGKEEEGSEEIEKHNKTVKTLNELNQMQRMRYRKVSQRRGHRK